MDWGWLSGISTSVSLVSTVVVAVATACLWWVTNNLAKETRRLADVSSQPHVVATIEPNRWSMMHLDLKVDNTGNATAYDIRVQFDPPLENGKARSGRAIPLQQVSVLKPGQGVSSYLSEFGPLSGKSYTVTISWLRDPSAKEREVNAYTLNISDLEGISRLGAFDPLTQIAEQMKKIREDWQSVARGSRKIKVDAFTSEDRVREREAIELRHQQQREDPNEASGDSSVR